MNYRDTMLRLQRAVLLRYLIDANFNASEAARRMEVHRNTVDQLCRRCGIDVDQLRENRKSLEVLVTMTEEERRNKYSNTYCRETLPNGVTCNTPIPVDQRVCAECQERRLTAVKPPATP